MSGIPQQFRHLFAKSKEQTIDVNLATDLGHHAYEQAHAAIARVAATANNPEEASLIIMQAVNYLYRWAKDAAELAGGGPKEAWDQITAVFAMSEDEIKQRAEEARRDGSA
jgi:D-arabinose 1-dehydrogenase-like Zn-dependent alcohol dehydrogenase